MKIYNHNPDLFLKNILVVNSINLRTLQSIAFHLHLHLFIDIDISRTDVDELRHVIHNQLSINKNILEDKSFKVMVETPKIDLCYFDFLRNYTKEYVSYVMNGWGVLDYHLLVNSFERNQSIEIIIGYLLDSASYRSIFLTRRLEEWRKNLDLIRNLAERAKWFDSIKKIETAKYIFLKNDRRKYLDAFMKNREIFFLDEKINPHEKEMIFLEIRARYNLQISRETNPKKQCNFSINPDAYKLMERLRKKSRLKKSEFIEAIFSPEHEDVLLKLIEQKKCPKNISKQPISELFG
ncbi:hypothetical protein SDC9_66071 [bioreactor metagenome]|uniref:Uncharacterized protein n=1 Tax=bioreactor metagenome TaxID=1076179 RepID=A0A644XU13_9ZZZZ